MTRVVVIIDENGLYQATYTDTEISCSVFKRGEHDIQIEKAESELEQVEE